jgi:hypothetical protein
MIHTIQADTETIIAECQLELLNRTTFFVKVIKIPQYINN